VAKWRVFLSKRETNQPAKKGEVPGQKPFHSRTTHGGKGGKTLLNRGKGNPSPGTGKERLPEQRFYASSQVEGGGWGEERDLFFPLKGEKEKAPQKVQSRSGSWAKDYKRSLGGGERGGKRANPEN